MIRRLCVLDFRNGIENDGDPRHRCGSLLENVCDPPEGNHRPDEHGKICNESGQRADGNITVDDALTAEINGRDHGNAD